MRSIITNTIGTKSGTCRATARETVVRFIEDGDIEAAYVGPTYETEATFANNEKGRKEAMQAATKIAHGEMLAHTLVGFKSLEHFLSLYTVTNEEDKDDFRIQKVIGTFGKDIRIIEAASSTERQAILEMFKLKADPETPIACVYAFDKAKCAIAVGEELGALINLKGNLLEWRPMDDNPIKMVIDEHYSQSNAFKP